MASVYIKINELNYITAIDSGVFISDTQQWIKIDEGSGDKYVYAQTYYLDKPLMDEMECYNFKYENNEVVERTQAEKDTEMLPQYIISKKVELSTVCEAIIVNGCDFGDEHYSMTLEDQANILAWMAVAQTGKAVPYHADGKPCRIYTAEEFMSVANTVVAYKTGQTTYCNLLMRQIEEMTDVYEIKAVTYGETKLNEKYQAQYDAIMASLVAEAV